MPPQSKPARVKLLDVPPMADETAADPVKRPKKLTQTKIDPATLRPPQPDASAEPPKRKTRPHKAVVFNYCRHHNDGSFRFSLVCYCLRTNVTYSTTGRRESELLNLARLMRRADMKCGHSHKFVVPYPLNTSKPVRWPKLSLRR